MPQLISITADDVDTLLESPLARHFTGISVRPSTDGPEDSLRVSLPRCHWLREVHLDLTSQRAARMPIDVVAMLTRLPYLHTIWTIDDRFTCDDLRALSQLSSLRSFRRFLHYEGGNRDWTLDELRAFCGPTHQLRQLTDIGRTQQSWFHVRAEHLALLSDLPSLRLMPPVDSPNLSIDCLRHVRRFPELLTRAGDGLQVRGGPDALDAFHSEVTLERLVAHVDILCGIESLKLDNLDVASDDLTGFMAAMTNLTFLGLSAPFFLSGIGVVVGLAAAPSLTALDISWCEQLSFDGIASLAACKRLTRLAISDSFGLEADEIAALQPPSSILPQLVGFIYQHGGDHDHEDDEDDEEEEEEAEEDA